MKSLSNNITKRDTSIIKGFAILCIVFHNYFHWLSPSPGENEFDFTPVRIGNLFQMLGDHPGEFVNILFSYFGHYGVQLFILVSGFGLALSMMNHPRTWESFVVTRLKKLYPLLLVGVLFYFFGKILVDGKVFSTYEKTELGYKLLFIHTLIPNSGLSLNGPWWFFGLIFQLYLLFPLLFRAMQRWGWKTFWVVCVLSYGLIFLFRDGLNLYHGSIVMQNAPGHLPEFCLGMMLAIKRDKRIHWIWSLVALALFVWGQFTPGIYPFTFLALSVMAVVVIEALRSWQPSSRLYRALLSVLNYFGTVSMTLFAVHGFFRTPVLRWANTLTTPLGHLWSGMVFFLIVWGLSIAAKALYDFMGVQLDKINIRESRATRLLGRIAQIALGLFFVFVLGYYVGQNLNRYDAEMSEYELQVESGAVAHQQEYVSLARSTFHQSHSLVRIQVSFDFCSLDTQAPLPSVVLEVKDALWKRMDLPAEDNTAEMKHYEFTYDYACPFVKNLKDKPMKIYFWNPGKGSIKFDNAKVTVLY